MRVREIDNNGDWTFGQSKANYITDEKAISQNVVTRIKSFKNDWFLDIEAEIDWFYLLGQKGTEKQILNEIERVVLGTTGVTKVIQLESIKHERVLTIYLSYLNIYNNVIKEEVKI